MDSEVDRNESDNVIEKNEKLADDSTGSDILSLFRGYSMSTEAHLIEIVQTVHVDYKP